MYDIAANFPSAINSYHRSTSIMEPIRWYFNRSGHSAATFIQASCSSVDIKRQVVHGLDMGGEKVEIDYDYLVVAVGAEPATFGISGTAPHVLLPNSNISDYQTTS